VSGLKLAVSNQGDHDMINFQVEDMSCGGCVRAIRAAVAAVAPQAVLEADVAARRVSIEGTDDAAALERAIAGAGFSALRVPDALGAAGGSGKAGKGCCCGPR
jgi:copper chaperone